MQSWLVHTNIIMH